MELNSKKPKIRIIVATHKKYQMPDSDIYLPVHVGAEGKINKEGNELDLGFVKDNTGDNISNKNASFCELTGLYWAWKNLDTDYIGLAHYRRHFMLKRKGTDPFQNILNSREAEVLVRKYRIILPKKRRYYIETLYSHYSHTHYSIHLDMARDIIKEKYPKYLESFDSVMKQTSGYMFNMMIIEKSLMDDYCTWLFEILFELEKRSENEELSFYQGRFYGRVSEILFNVWLKQQLIDKKVARNDIKEISCIYTEPIDWKRKISSFLKAKFAHRKYEGSF